MIQTLRSSNGSFSNVGNPQLQAQPLAPGEPVQQPNIYPVITVGQNVVASLQEPSVDALAAQLRSANRVVIPLSTPPNVVAPAYDSAMTQPGQRAADATSEVSTVTAKLQPYEAISGLAQLRPEIIMLMQLLPLTNRDARNDGAKRLAGHSAPVGDYFHAQHQLRALRSTNVVEQINALDEQYPSVSNLLRQRQDSFRRELASLKSDAAFMLNFVRMLESQKIQLDLRHDLYKVDTDAVSSYVASNFHQHHPTIAPQSINLLNQLAQLGLKPSYDFVTTLVDLGYVEATVRRTFLSSKIWMQTIVEATRMLQFHSLQLVGADPFYQRNDASPAVINVPPAAYFGLATESPNIVNLDELVNVSTGAVSPVLNSVIAAYRSLYQNGSFKDEEGRIAALAHILTREYKYSYGLTVPSTVAALRAYGYDVVPGKNPPLLAAIFGRPSNNVTDFHDDQPLSLISLAQQRPTPNVGVLTFETQYIDGDAGTLTPGSDYYVDSTMNGGAALFDTGRLSTLASTLDDQLQRFSVVVDAFNMMNLPSSQGYATGLWASTSANFLASANDTIQRFASQLFDRSTGVPRQEIANDALGSVFAQARLDDRIKSLLFMLVMCKISRSYNNRVPFLSADPSNDNTPTVDLIVELLGSAISLTTNSSATATQLSNRSLNGNSSMTVTVASLKQSLRQGTALLNIVEEFMSAVVTQFRVTTTAISGNFTRYNGYLDTAVMMVAFDLVVSLVAQYTNQRLVGSHLGLLQFQQNVSVLSIVSTNVDHRESFNQLLQRSESENNIVRQVLFTIINALRSLGDSLRGITNYISSVETQDRLKQLIEPLGLEPGLLKLLLSQQQILLMASEVENLAAAAGDSGINGQPILSNPSSGLPRRSTLPRLLDEGNALPQVRDAVLGYLSNGDLASNAALNKRVLSVGVPLGFTQLLKQRSNLNGTSRASSDLKKTDIVFVTVYKVDVQNPDIVYKPQRFMFEMSRFAVPYTTGRWLSMVDQPRLSDVIAAVPTQSFNFDSSSRFLAGGSTVEYSPAAGPAVGKSHAIAFNDPSYDFLSNAQRNELISNHVISQLLETYVKILTGVDLSERAFSLVENPSLIDDELLQQLLQSTIDQVAGRPAATQPKKVQAFSNERLRQAVPTIVRGTTTTALRGSTSLTADGEKEVLDRMRSINGLMHSISTVVDAQAIRRSVMAPKIFDRVFNVVVDSRDFIVDIATTNSTPFGKQALELLVKSGVLIAPTTGAADARAGSDASSQLRSRDRTAGDLVTDKYIITVETLDEAMR